MNSRITTDYLYDGSKLRADPDTIFDQIRQQGDVLWSSSMRRWLVVSERSAKAAMAHKELHVINLESIFEKISKHKDVEFTALKRMTPWFPFFFEGQKHNQLRRLFATFLNQIRKEYLVEFGLVSKRLLSLLAAKGVADFSKEYADRIHVEAIGSLAGLDDDARLELSRILSSNGIVDYGARLIDTLRAEKRIARALVILNEQTESSHGINFFTQVRLSLSSAGFGGTTQNAIEFTLALMLEGRDTISGSLSIGLCHLLDTFDGTLSSENWPEIDVVLENFLRLTSTTQYVVRQAMQDVLLNGQLIVKGELVNIYLGAANRDPEVHRCPHSFDDTNSTNVAFGYSKHLCIAAPIAREAIAIALNQLRDINTIQSLPDSVLSSSAVIRKYTSLPINLK